MGTPLTGALNAWHMKRIVIFPTISRFVSKVVQGSDMHVLTRTTPNSVFKVSPLFNGEYLRNGTR